VIFPVLYPDDVGPFLSAQS